MRDAVTTMRMFLRRILAAMLFALAGYVLYDAAAHGRLRPGSPAAE